VPPNAKQDPEVVVMLATGRKFLILKTAVLGWWNAKPGSPSSSKM